MIGCGRDAITQDTTHADTSTSARHRRLTWRARCGRSECQMKNIIGLRCRTPAQNGTRSAAAEERIALDTSRRFGAGEPRGTPAGRNQQQSEQQIQYSTEYSTEYRTVCTPYSPTKQACPHGCTAQQQKLGRGQRTFSSLPSDVGARTPSRMENHRRETYTLRALCTYSLWYCNTGRLPELAKVLCSTFRFVLSVSLSTRRSPPLFLLLPRNPPPAL